MEALKVVTFNKLWITFEIEKVSCFRTITTRGNTGQLPICISRQAFINGRQINYAISSRFTGNKTWLLSIFIHTLVNAK